MEGTIFGRKITHEIPDYDCIKTCIDYYELADGTIIAVEHDNNGYIKIFTKNEEEWMVREWEKPESAGEVLMNYIEWYLENHENFNINEVKILIDKSVLHALYPPSENN